jgi:hypothetical protein
MKKYLIVSLFMALLSSCFYDNASEMYPAASLNQNCDTLSVTYNDDLVPLFQNNCGTNGGCHSAGKADGEVILDSYNQAVLVDEITLLGSVQHLQGYKPMPPSGMMGDCGIKQIELWIQNGKPE